MNQVEKNKFINVIDNIIQENNISKKYDQIKQATNKEIEIYGISHAEFGRQDIVREFILIDEISIWKQILI